MHSDLELLETVCEVEDFAGSVFYKDALPDWNLAKELGEFLLRIGDVHAMAYVLLARAHRHLGDLERAREALKQCKTRVASGELTPAEEELFCRAVSGRRKAAVARGWHVDPGNTLVNIFF